MKQPNNTAGVSSQRKQFDEEFRREAVALLEAGRNATQLSRELGVSTWSLCQWKKRWAGAAQAAAPGQSPQSLRAGEASPVALADEVARLRAELHTVSRQRDILKKALSILGQDNLHSSI
jgi:transposase